MQKASTWTGTLCTGYYSSTPGNFGSRPSNQADATQAPRRRPSPPKPHCPPSSGPRCWARPQATHTRSAPVSPAAPFVVHQSAVRASGHRNALSNTAQLCAVLRSDCPTNSLCRHSEHWPSEKYAPQPPVADVTWKHFEFCRNTPFCTRHSPAPSVDFPKLGSGLARAAGARVREYSWQRSTESPAPRFCARRRLP